MDLEASKSMKARSNQALQPTYLPPPRYGKSPAELGRSASL